jgi:hypothetical protein
MMQLLLAAAGLAATAAPPGPSPALRPLTVVPRHATVTFLAGDYRLVPVQTPAGPRVRLEAAGVVIEAKGLRFKTPAGVVEAEAVSGSNCSVRVLPVR